MRRLLPKLSAFLGAPAFLTIVTAGIKVYAAEYVLASFYGIPAREKEPKYIDLTFSRITSDFGGPLLFKGSRK